MMILVGHVVDNLTGIVCRNDVCLLRSPYVRSKMVRLTANNGSRIEVAKGLQGCYLHYNSEAGAWVRSGKATGQSFDDRLKQMSDAA